MKMIKRLNSALYQGVSKLVFDHVRNYMICAFVLAIGTTALREDQSQFFGIIPSGYGGLGVIALGAMLILFNLYDGVRRIAKSKYHSVFIVLLVFLYLFMTARVVEMAWDFRDLAEASPTRQ